MKPDKDVLRYLRRRYYRQSRAKKTRHNPSLRPLIEVFEEHSRFCTCQHKEGRVIGIKVYTMENARKDPVPVHIGGSDVLMPVLPLLRPYWKHSHP